MRRKNPCTPAGQAYEAQGRAFQPGLTLPRSQQVTLLQRQDLVSAAHLCHCMLDCRC